MLIFSAFCIILATRGAQEMYLQFPMGCYVSLLPPSLLYIFFFNQKHTQQQVFTSQAVAFTNSANASSRVCTSLVIKEWKCRGAATQTHQGSSLTTMKMAKFAHIFITLAKEHFLSTLLRNGLNTAFFVGKMHPKRVHF